MNGGYIFPESEIYQHFVIDDNNKLLSVDVKCVDPKNLGATEHPTIVISRSCQPYLSNGVSIFCYFLAHFYVAFY